MARIAGRCWMAGILLIAGVSSARGQVLGGGTSAGFGVSPVVTFAPGGTTYLPFGGGGFVPYAGGAGGGLGVQSRRAAMGATAPASAAMPMGGSMGPGLGQARSAIVPLRPVRLMSAGRGGGMAGGSMLPRPPSGGSMSGMGRPPVGGYPFRQPPSLTGPAGPVMSMSM
jgi:hypothetical protein